MNGTHDPAALTRRSPAWSSWVLPALLLATAVLYLWGLSESGWANAFYSAAAQAGSESWKAFFFGSSDAANLITVDKPPAALWVMGLSVRVFGLNAWSILVPQALMGVASVWALYAAVRRRHGRAAALIAGAVLALTPVATLMFRFNNPDALLTLLLTFAAYCVVRALEADASRWWVVGVGATLGAAFLTKSLQAFLVIPAFALVWVVAAPTGMRRRVLDLLLAAGVMLVCGGWWVAVVELWPAASRPFIGGSQSNSVVELIFGYNGFGRLTGEEVGSVVPGGGRGGTGGMWGPTGLTRLFDSEYGGQIAWLLPAALILLAVLVVLTWRRPRTDAVRASALLWGGWLVVTGLVLSLAAGIIHAYYTVVLAPAIGALIGIGTVELWRRRHEPAWRATLAAIVALTAVWAAVPLGRSPEWMPWLRPTLVVLGVGAAVAFLLVRELPRRIAAGVATAGVVILLAAPAASSLQTAATPHTGAIVLAGPAVASGRGPLGAGGPGGAGGAQPGFAGPGSPGPAQGMALPPPAGSAFRPDGQAGVAGGPDGPGVRPGGTGGLLDAAEPSEEVTALLAEDAERYTWVAAAVGSNSAAGYQLATQAPVMSLGGFNGSDPYPSVEIFRELVARGKVHWFIGGGRGPGGGGGVGPGGSADSNQMGGSDAAREISEWVEENFPSRTVDGVTLYDLTA